MDIRNLTVEVRDKNLNRLGQIALTDLDLLVEDQFSNVGSWTVNLRSNHPLAGALCTPGAGIIVSDTSGNTLMSGPVTQTDDKATIEDPGGTITIDGLSDTLILADRLAFPDPDDGAADTQAKAYDVRTDTAEDLMHAYVSANLGPSAPAARTISSLQMGTNGHRGATVTKRARFDVLGNLLNELGLASGLGFRILQVAGHLEFQTYAVNDRSADVRYDIYNNMLSGHSAQTAPPGVTRAIVGGDGAKLNRPFVEVTSSDSLAAESLWGRRIEHFIDQRSTDTVSELTQAGKDALADSGFAQQGIQIVPMEDIGVGDYGNKFTLGDYVTVVVKGVQYAVQVTGYVLKRNSDGFKFGLVLGNPGAKKEAAQVTAKVAKLEGRVSNLERNAEAGGVAELSDATITTPATGQVLQYSGTGWVNAQATMAQLGDTAINSPASRNILMWDNAAGKWVNKPTVVLTATDSTTDVYALAQGPDTFNRWKVKGDGATWWGPGNATQDTNLYRKAADVLATDDSLNLTDNTKQLVIGTTASTAAVAVQKAGTTDIAFSSQVGAEAQRRFRIGADGKLDWGDGTNAQDTNLYRSAANTLATDDNLSLTDGTKQVNVGAASMAATFAAKRAAATDDILSAQVTSDTQGRVYVDASGKIKWGSGSAAVDTNLYRSAADTLKTDDSLAVGTNLTVAGTAAVTGASTFTGKMTANGGITSKGDVYLNPSITPVANTPTTLNVTYPALAGSGTIYAFISANTSVIGSTVMGVSTGTPTSTDVDLYIYRTNTTATGVYVHVHREP